MSKSKNKKTICTENKISALIPIPASVTAEIVHGSESMVKKVRSGDRTGGEMCEKIILADDLLTTVINAGVQEVKNIINK